MKPPAGLNAPLSEAPHAHLAPPGLWTMEDQRKSRVQNIIFPMYTGTREGILSGVAPALIV